MKYLFIFSLTLFSFTSFAQTKIGYTNVELVLAYMPEVKTMESQLQTYQKKLAEKIKVKDDYVKMKYQEYMDLKERNALSSEDAKTREEELLRLDQEVQKMASDSEYDLMAKRQELLEPILKKLQDALDGVAQEGSYTYILNQTTSAGVSTILFGPEEHDVTEAVMKKLGIPIPNSNN